jgi:recombination protein RecT
MAKNEVTVKFSEKLMDKLLSVDTALPKDFNKERFVQNCIAVLNENPNLAQINPAQTIQGLLKGAYLGLDFLNRECYLIPYNNTVQFQTDYKGETKFTKKYSIRPILDIYAKVVREGDEFIEEIVDGKPTIQFRPKTFSKAEIIGAFAVVLFKDGGLLYETMSTDDINSVRNNYSKASNSKAWKYSYDEMCKKTVLRRLSKHVDTSFESVEARAAWEEGAGMDFKTSANPVNDREEVIDVFADVSGEEITEQDVITADYEQIELQEETN